MKRRNWIGALFSALLVVGAAGVGPSTAAATDTTTGTYAATTDSSATATTDSTAVPVVTTEAITTEAATTAALPSEPAGQAAQNANSASAGTEPPVSEATAEPSTDPTVAASPTPVEEKTLSVGAKPAPPTIAVTVTAGDFIAGNNGNGLWKIQVSNPSELSFTGPIEATVTVPAPQVIDTNVGSIGWRCTGVGTNVATCTLNTALSAGTPAPLLQLPVVLPKGVAGTTTVDVDVSATTGAQPATVSASQSGSASIKPAIDNPVEPVDPSSGVDLGVDAPYTKALVGESYRQMVYVYNEGDVASTGPTTVTIAANGTTISSVTATGWTCVTDAAQATATCTHPNGIPAGGELPPIALDTMNVGFVGSHVSTIPERLRFDVVVSSPDTDVYPRDNTTVALPLVLLQTNLQLIKEGPAQAAPGARVSYALTPLEINEATLLPIVIEDTLPVGATWVPTPDERWSCVLDAAAGPAGTVRCTYQGSLRQSVWLSITVDLAEDLTPDSQVTNTARLITPTPEADTTDNVASTTLTVIPPEVSLDLIKYAEYNGLLVEGNLGWMMSVTNTGNSTARGPIVVTDTLPDDLAYVGFTTEGNSPGWTCDPAGQVVTCTYAYNLPNGASTPSIRLQTVTVGETENGQTFTNTATVSLAGSSEVLDTETASGRLVWTFDLSVDKMVEKGVPFIAGAGYSTAFTADAQALAGATKWNVWKFTVTNNSDRDYDQSTSPFRLFDRLPDGTTFVGALQGSCFDPYGNGIVQCWSDATLPAGGSVEFQIITSVDISATPGTELTNSVRLFALADDTPANDEASATAVVQSPITDLRLRKSEGRYNAQTRTIRYDIYVSNSGPTAYNGPLRVVDTLPLRTDGDGHLVLDSALVGEYFGGTCNASTTDPRSVTCDVTPRGLMEPGREYVLATLMTKPLDPTIELQTFAPNCARLDWQGLTRPNGDQLPNNSTCSYAGTGYDASVKQLNLTLTKTTDYGHDFFFMESTMMRPYPLLVAGDEVNYHVSIKNTGRDPWTADIPILDQLTSDGSIELVSITTTGGLTCNPSGFPGINPSVSCRSTDDLAVGAEATLDLVIRPATDSAIDNTAQIDWADGAGDGSAYDDSATVQLVGRRPSDVNFEKYFDSEYFAQDENGRVLIPPSGSGSFVLGSFVNPYEYGSNEPTTYLSVPIVVTDVVPSQFTITSVDSGHPDNVCTVVGQKVTCTFDPGAKVINFGLAARINVTWSGLAAGTITNSATYSDADGNEKKSSASVTVPRVDLGIRKSTPLAGTPVPMGGYVPFSVVVTNNGSESVRGLSFTDSLPPNFKLVSVSGNGWTCAPAAEPSPGRTTNLTITCTSPQVLGAGASSTPVEILTTTTTTRGGFNMVQLTPPVGDANSQNDQSGASVRGSTTPLVENPAISTRLRGRIIPGEIVNWGITVTNPGTVTITDPVIVTAVIPEGLTYEGFVGPGGWSCSSVGGPPQVVTCINDTDLMNQSTAYPSLDLTLRADENLAGDEIFTLTAMLGTDRLVDSNVANNQADESAMAQPLPKPAISVVKTTNGVDVAVAADMPKLVAGATVTWTYVVTNTGNRDLTNITLVDNPEGFITCPVTSLAVGQSTTCTATGTVVEGTYTNTVTVSADGRGPKGLTTVTASDVSGYVGHKQSPPPVDEPPASSPNVTVPTRPSPPITQPLGPTPTSPRQLPDTGAGVGDQLLLALSVLLVGLAARAASRRRRLTS